MTQIKTQHDTRHGALTRMPGETEGAGGDACSPWSA